MNSFVFDQTLDMIATSILFNVGLIVIGWVLSIYAGIRIADMWRQ